MVDRYLVNSFRFDLFLKDLKLTWYSSSCSMVNALCTPPILVVSWYKYPAETVRYERPMPHRLVYTLRGIGVSNTDLSTYWFILVSHKILNLRPGRSISISWHDMFYIYICIFLIDKYCSFRSVFCVLPGVLPSFLATALGGSRAKRWTASAFITMSCKIRTAVPR